MQISTTIILIAINVIASMYAWKNRDIYSKWMMNPYAVASKNEFHRFITSGFIHVDQMHLFFNMFTLYFFGDNVEYICKSIFGPSGTLVFIGFYLLAIVVSEIPTFLKNKNNPGYNSLGASGAVSAIVFCHIMFQPTAKLYLFGIIGIPGFILGIGYLIYSYKMGKESRDNINHDAHFYGAILGVIFSILISPEVIQLFVQQIANYNPFN